MALSGWCGVHGRPDCDGCERHGRAATCACVGCQHRGDERGSGGGECENKASPGPRTWLNATQDSDHLPHYREGLVT